MLPIAICVIVALVIIFIITYVINHRIPAPKSAHSLREKTEECTKCPLECDIKESK